MDSLRQHLVLVLVIGLLLVAMLWRQDSASAAQPLPQRLAEPWMLDCLPGIGPKRLHRACADLRQNNVAALPESAQALARQLFAP